MVQSWTIKCDSPLHDFSKSLLKLFISWSSWGKCWAQTLHLDWLWGNCPSTNGGVTADRRNTEEVWGGFQAFILLGNDSFNQELLALQGVGAGGGQVTSQLHTPYYLPLLNTPSSPQLTPLLGMFSPILSYAVSSEAPFSTHLIFHPLPLPCHPHLQFLLCFVHVLQLWLHHISLRLSAYVSITSTRLCDSTDERLWHTFMCVFECI